MKTSEFPKKLNEDLLTIIDQVENFTKLSDSELNWKENSESWSILECIEHLNRYNQYYITVIERAFHTAGKFVHEDVKSTWIGAKSLNMMLPTNTKKQKTFKKMNPINSKISREVMEKFLDDQKRLKELLRVALEININAKKVPVEFLRLLKMSIAEALEFVIVHQHRHMLQACSITTKFAVKMD